MNDHEDFERCPKCDTPIGEISRHVTDGDRCRALVAERQLTAAHARIAELIKELSDRTIECGRADALRDGVKALATRCEQSSQGLSAIMPNGAAVYARMADELTALLGHNNNQEQP